MTHRITRPPLAVMFIVAALGWALDPSEAWAQHGPTAAPASPPEGEQPNEEALAEAARRYDLGLKLYAEGEFRLAVIEFERTYQLTSDYRVLYNIGQVRIQLGNYARAIKALKDYLDKGADKISEERRTAVEADLEMLASRTGHVRIVVSVAGADILIDDLPIGQSPLADQILLDAGEHKITARESGYETRTIPLTLAGKDTMTVELKLQKLPERRDRIIERQVPKESNTTWMIATWSATGVFAVTAGVTGFLGVKTAGDLEEQRKQEGVSNDTRDDTSRRARTLLLTTDVLGGLAIVTGGVALYLTLSDPGGSADEKEAPKTKPKPVPAKTGLVIGPNQVALEGSF